MSTFKPDRAKIMAIQLTSKGYFAGEAVGFRFGRASGEYSYQAYVSPSVLSSNLPRPGRSG